MTRSVSSLASIGQLKLGKTELVKVEVLTLLYSGGQSAPRKEKKEEKREGENVSMTMKLRCFKRESTYFFLN